MKITALGVVTCDRTPALRRCLESYAANSRDHDRAPAFIVVDDSRASETQERNRRAAAEVAGRFGAPIRYAGRREKTRFVRETAIGAAAFGDADFLALHETLLGSAAGQGRVALTMPGLVGDSGMGSARHYFALAGASHEAATRDRVIS